MIAPVDPRDAPLLAAARAAYPDVAYDECTHARLAAIAHTHGIDFATAFFYERVCAAPATRAFLDRLDALGPESHHAPPTHLHGRVIIAPGAFYREHPRYGSDGRAVREAAERLGLSVDMVPVASLGGVHENAAIVQAHLAALRHSTEPIVIVSLSKGGADVRLAFDRLQQLGQMPASVRAWIQICGLVHGTPVADRVMASWWRRSGVAAYLALRGGSITIVREIAAGAGHAPLDQPPLRQPPLGRPLLRQERAAAPDGVLVINVIGFPLRRHLFGLTRLRHRFMAPQGPSDGLALLRDEIIEPGVTFPVWGSDHYFRLPGVPIVLNRLFRYLGQEGVLHARAA